MILSILSGIVIGAVNKARGGTFSADAALFGVSVSLTGRSPLNRLLAFINGRATAIIGQSFGLGNMTLLLPSLLVSAAAGISSTGLVGMGVTVGAEICATATDLKVGGFAFGGPILGSVGAGALGWSVSVYAGVVWNVPTIESYRSYPAPMFSFGIADGFGKILGGTHVLFSNPSVTQYGQLTGVNFSSKVLPSVSGAVTWSAGPKIFGVGFDAVRYWLAFAWPPPQNLFLSLKAIGLAY